MDPDPDYLERRAEQELAAAQQATDGRAVRAHCELLERYLDLLHPPTEPTLPPAR